MRKGTKLAILVMFLSIVFSVLFIIAITHLGGWIIPIMILLLFTVIDYIFNKEY